MIYNRYISKKLWKFSIYVAHIDISNKKLYHDISSFVINIYERYIKIYHLPKYIIITLYIDISKYIMIYHKILILTIFFQILRYRLQSSLILHKKFNQDLTKTFDLNLLYEVHDFQYIYFIHPSIQDDILMFLWG